MDLIHKFLNIIVPILSTILFIIVFPLLSLYRIFKYCFRTLFPEKLEGKVVLIAGASSGIGEHMAYEYAKHGVSLALVARREELLVDVATKAKALGSPDVIVIKADVSKIDDCKRFVNETVNHFGKLDCLINNAAIGICGLFEDQERITDHIPIMDVNFWGSVNATHFALPHLKKSKGRIVVIGSCGGWFNTQTVSIYNASKAAQQSFFETLRTELGSDVKITMVTPGIINTVLASNEFIDEANLKWMPMESVEGCAKAIVNSVRRGDEYLTEPRWMDTVFIWAVLLPELINSFRSLLAQQPKSRVQDKKSHINASLDVKHD